MTSLIPSEERIMTILKKTGAFREGIFEHPGGFFTESSPYRPNSPYAASKAAFDMHLLSIHNTLKFPMNIIRPSNAYGPGQQLHRVIPKAILFGLTGRRLPLHGGGRAEKSYIHSRDLARAILLVADKAPLGTVYNAGPAEPTSIRRVVELVAESAKPIPLEQAEEAAAKAEAAEKIWTPEKEQAEAGEGAGGGKLWTPGE